MAVSRETLCYVFRSGEDGQRQVLLGRKKRGFGTGKIMGLGGKVEPGESDAACAVREAGEEAGITVAPGSPTWRAELPLGQMWDDEAYWLPRCWPARHWPE